MRTLFIILLLTTVQAKAQKPLFNCRILDVIAKDENVFNKTGTFILVDTFQFFSTACTGLYYGKHITIVDTLPKFSELPSNLFAVSGIGTTDSTLAIGILRLYSNYQVAYYLSILGNQIVIKKGKIGHF